MYHTRSMLVTPPPHPATHRQRKPCRLCDRYITCKERPCQQHCNNHAGTCRPLQSKAFTCVLRELHVHIDAYAVAPVQRQTGYSSRIFLERPVRTAPAPRPWAGTRVQTDVHISAVSAAACCCVPAKLALLTSCAAKVAQLLAALMDGMGEAAATHVTVKQTSFSGTHCV